MGLLTRRLQWAGPSWDRERCARTVRADPLTVAFEEAPCDATPVHPSILRVFALDGDLLIFVASPSHQQQLQAIQRVIQALLQGLDRLFRPVTLQHIN